MLEYDSSAYSFRARVRLKQNRLSEAIEDVNAAVEVDPKSAGGHYMKARVLLAQAGNLSARGRAKAFDPDEPRSIVNQAGEELCDTLMLSPRHLPAGEYFEEVLSGLRRARPWPLPRRQETSRTLAGTPPPEIRLPGCCFHLSVSDEGFDSVRFAWTAPSDDGGDEICRYDVEVAARDLINPEETPLQFRHAYSGLQLDIVVSPLSADTDVVLRVAAWNSKGRGPWSDEACASTKPYSAPPRDLDDSIPQPWLDLRLNMPDLIKKFDADERAWLELVNAWRAHLGTLKLAYRLYTLLESPESDPKDINLTQFRRFVEDCGIPVSKVETDPIFTRVNRNLTSQQTGKAAGTGAKSAAERADKMGQEEFVHAIVRLGVVCAERNAKAAGRPANMCTCFHDLMKECVKPHAIFELDDELSEALRSRSVRAVFAKHQHGLEEQFKRWSSSDKSLGDSCETMSLNELTVAFKEAKLFDELCTPREVTTFFVMVNADDEIYKPTGGVGGKDSHSGAAELDYSEFLEIAARMCNEKIPAACRTVPFEQTLDTWLGLAFLPALRNAGKALDGGGGKGAGPVRRSKGISLQSSNQANIIGK